LPYARKESSEFLTINEFFIETEVGVKSSPLTAVASKVLLAKASFEVFIGDFIVDYFLVEFISLLGELSFMVIDFLTGETSSLTSS
jgi:hypothetical protein